MAFPVGLQPIVIEVVEFGDYAIENLMVINLTLNANRSEIWNFATNILAFQLVDSHVGHLWSHRIACSASTHANFFLAQKFQKILSCTL